MGSLASASWDTNTLMLLVAFVGLIFFCTQYRTLNLMLLGDESAITLGTDLHRWRILYLLVTSVLVGYAVFNAGMIGFVGLIIPHAVRMFFGTDHKKLLPLAADVLCRIVIEHAELPIGILTSMIGAPCFVYLMVRRSYGFGGGER